MSLQRLRRQRLREDVSWFLRFRHTSDVDDTFFVFILQAEPQRYLRLMWRLCLLTPILLAKDVADVLSVWLSMQSDDSTWLRFSVIRDVKDVLLHASLRLIQQLEDVDGLIEATAKARSSGSAEL